MKKILMKKILVNKIKFFSAYIKHWSIKHKEKLRKKACERYQNLSEEEKDKR